MDKIRKGLYSVLCSVIAVSFLKLLLDILGRDFVPRTVGGSAFRIIQWCVGSVIIFFIYRLLKRTERIWERHGNKVLAGGVIFLFVAQMLFGNELRVNPLYDYSSLYHGATDWIVTGTFERFYDYYYYYPNNIAPMTLLMIVFQMAAKVGISDFYLMGMLLNCILSAGMVIATYFVCKKVCGATEAVFSLALYLIYPPMYLLASVFYTDQLTMIFPALIFLIYIYLDGSKTKVFSGVLSICLAIVTVLGYMLKPTVFIMWIAVLISLLLSAQWKKAVLILAAFLLIYTGVNSVFDTYIYENHLERQTADRMNTPLETWVMMGLNDNPGFSPDDTEFSRSIEDPVERKETIRKEIVRRIEEKGFTGMAEHLKNKGIQAFSDGSFELSYTFLFGFQKDTGLKNTLTLLGDNYDAYWDFCSSIWYVYLIFCVCYMLVTAVFCWKGHNIERRWVPVSLAAFGLLCFLLLWEVHARYMVNFFSCFVMMTVCGVAGINQGVIKRKGK